MAIKLHEYSESGFLVIDSNVTGDVDFVLWAGGSGGTGPYGGTTGGGGAAGECASGKFTIAGGRRFDFTIGAGSAGGAEGEPTPPTEAGGDSDLVDSLTSGDDVHLHATGAFGANYSGGSGGGYGNGIVTGNLCISGVLHKGGSGAPGTEPSSSTKGGGGGASGDPTSDGLSAVDWQGAQAFGRDSAAGGNGGDTGDNGQDGNSPGAGGGGGGSSGGIGGNGANGLLLCFYRTTPARPDGWPISFKANLDNGIDGTGGPIDMVFTEDIENTAVAANAPAFVLSRGSFPVLHEAGYLGGLATATPWVFVIVNDRIHLFINDGGDDIHTSESYSWRWNGMTFVDYEESGRMPYEIGLWSGGGGVMTTQEFSDFQFPSSGGKVASKIFALFNSLRG